jgi:hypothetical protein
LADVVNWSTYSRSNLDMLIRVGYDIVFDHAVPAPIIAWLYRA